MPKPARGGRRSRGQQGDVPRITRRRVELEDTLGTSNDLSPYARLSGSSGSGGGRATARTPNSNNGTSRRGGSSADNGGRIR